MEAYIEAHKYSRNNMAQLKNYKICGCFYCLKIFSPTEIDDCLIADNDADRLGTALCPYCHIDSVMGASSDYPITEEFLEEMRKHWF